MRRDKTPRLTRFVRVLQLYIPIARERSGRSRKEVEARRNEGGDNLSSTKLATQYPIFLSLKDSFSLLFAYKAAKDGFNFFTKQFNLLESQKETNYW